MGIIDEFTQHRNALLKALNDTHVPVGINSDNLAAMVSKVIRSYRVIAMKSFLLKG